MLDPGYGRPDADARQGPPGPGRSGRAGGRSGPAERGGGEQQVLLADRVEAHGGLGPRALPLGADDHAAAPVVVHDLVPGDQPEVLSAGAAPGSGPAAAAGAGGAG